MFAFSTFASGYVMRFLGAVTLGPYFDHAGRRRGLLISFSLMALGTCLLAASPTYATIGIAAPILLVIGRMIQGFSAGSETGGLTAYLLEIAPPGRNAFYVAWNSNAFLFASLVATALGFALQSQMPAAALHAWGWRLPFVAGCGIIPLIFVLRWNLPETGAFATQVRHPTMDEVLNAVLRNWRIALAGMLVTVLTSCMFYFLFVFMPVFARESMTLSLAASFYPAILTIFYSMVMVTGFSLLSDRIGRFPLIFGSSILILLTAYPTLRFLTVQPSYQRLILAQLWFATLYAAHSSSSFVGLSEAVPARIRATGYGVTTTLGLAIFGGGTPLASVWLVSATGSKSAPALWLMLVAVASVTASYFLFIRKIAVRDTQPGPRKTVASPVAAADLS